MKKLLLLSIVAIITLTSCVVVEEQPCVYASNFISLEERYLPYYTGINVMTNADVYLSEGENPMIEIEAADNVLPFIYTEINRGVLEIFIDPSVCIRSLGPITIYAQMPSIDYIEQNGPGLITNLTTITNRRLDILHTSSGNVELFDVDLRRMAIDMTGSGYTYVDGSYEVRHMALTHTGSGLVDVSWLPVENMDAVMAGSGDADLWVLDYMEADIMGSGYIYVYGQPAMDYTISGTGGVIMQKSKRSQKKEMKPSKK